jgi:hypothetical protein
MKGGPHQQKDKPLVNFFKLFIRGNKQSAISTQTF